tara:strand:- start:150 stop:575 length:426 start_codon:yes stop_codon:yes gene_type:complete
LLHALSEANVRRWIALSEGQGGTIGLLTTHGRKEQYMLLVREALRMGTISLHDDFFSLTLGTRDARTRLTEELENFSVVTEPSKTLFGQTRRTFTGKLGGKQDDVVLALQMSLYGAKAFWTDHKYQQYRQNTLIGRDAPTL